MTVYNFAAGPATLPDPVIKQIQEELPSINGSGMSIMEISHRSALFDDIINAAEQDVRELMHVPDNYHVLFFQGGGTGQFAAVPMNLATNHHKIALLDSGHWATKAGDEATNLGYQVDVLASTKDQHYQALPHANTPISAQDYDYLHITTNNTIEGTAYHELPEHGDVTLVGDLSSNFMAENYNVSDFGLIFGGVQKTWGQPELRSSLSEMTWLNQLNIFQVSSITIYSLKELDVQHATRLQYLRNRLSFKVVKRTRRDRRNWAG